MALRLLKILVPAGEEARVRKVLAEHGEFPSWLSQLEGGSIEVQALLPAEGNDPVLNALRKDLEHLEGFRLVLVPVQATVPRMEEPEDEPPSEPADEDPEKKHHRVNLEELYTSMSADARASRYYLTMVALSSVVACAGLMMGDTAVIIGAMVIAPLLGPNMALAFATTLGDLELGRSAWWTAAVGGMVALAVAVLGGVLFTIDPEGAEIASRTRVSGGHVALALAAGSAGALSLTRGIAAGLVGVMVAVALLPPLAAAGLLLGDGHGEEGVGALLLVAANVACVNLAGIGTFLVQGVRPRALWESGRAKRATTVAVLLWTGLVAALLLAVWLAWD
jgi:uncharacterized hydrophobic protein (TIGR00341 family)